MAADTQQQKVFLSEAARMKLREEAARTGWNLSEVVEFLIVRGARPPDAPSGDKG